jgi:integrase
MARTRVSKTVTVGELKFKPLARRERSTPAGVERYWQARRYVGIIDGKPRRQDIWSGWARQDQLAGIAANLDAPPRGEVQIERSPGLVTRDQLRAGTVEMLVRAWRGERQSDKDYSEDTRKLDKTIQNRLVASLGPIKVADVDGPRTGEFLRKELRRSYAVSTTRLTMTVFASIWNKWAIPREIVDRPIDFTASYRRLKKTEQAGHNTGARDKTTPKEDEAWAIVDALDECAPQWAGLAFRLLLMTGGRIGEIAVLTWGQISDGLVGLTGKTGPRQVDVDARALRHVLMQRPSDAADSDRVLPVTVNTAKKHLATYIDRACARAEVPRITPHALRRFAAQRYIRSPVRLAVAAAQLGHTPEVMMRAYEQVQPEEKREAALTVALGVRPVPETGTDKVVKLHR